MALDINNYLVYWRETLGGMRIGRKKSFKYYKTKIIRDESSGFLLFELLAF